MRLILLLFFSIFIYSCSPYLKYTSPANPSEQSNTFLDSLKNESIDSIIRYTISSGCVVPEEIHEVYFLWKHDNIRYLKKMDRYGSTSDITVRDFLNEEIFEIIDLNFNDQMTNSDQYEIGCHIDAIEILLPEKHESFRVIEKDKLLNIKNNKVLLINNLRSFLFTYSTIINQDYSLRRDRKKQSKFR